MEYRPDFRVYISVAWWQGGFSGGYEGVWKKLFLDDNYKKSEERDCGKLQILL